MIANGTIKTIEDNEDIYISLTALCEYFVHSATTMQKEIEDAPKGSEGYARGISDLMFTIAQEFVDLGKFESQRRMISTPEDLLKMTPKDPFPEQ